MWCPINRSFGNYLEIFGDAHVVKILGQMPTLPDHAQFMPGTKSIRRSSWQQTRLHNITFRPLKLQQLQYPRPWGDRVQVGSLKKDGSRNPYQTHKASNNHTIGPVLFVRPRGTIPFFPYLKLEWYSDVADVLVTGWCQEFVSSLLLDSFGAGSKNKCQEDCRGVATSTRIIEI